MARYIPLCTLTVRHTFFADEVCKALEFAPSAETADWLKRAGLLIKPFADGIGIYYTEDRIDVLRRHIDDVANGLLLNFKAFAKDPYFCQYTFPIVNSGDRVLGFDSHHSIADASGMRLHPEEYVSEAFYREADGNAPLPAPVFTADIHVTGADCVPPGEEGSPASRHYYVVFDARKTFWKYYFLGEMARKNAYIADLNGSTEFERIDAPELQGRDALVFMSRAPISMQDVPPQRFQLRSRESAGAGEKILIKRLPNASSNRIGKGKLDGKEVLVSEIYVNQ